LGDQAGVLKFADRDEHDLKSLEFYFVEVHVTESIIWRFISQKVKSMEGNMMIRRWFYAALVTDRQIPKGMSSHDAI
jgi:hypothetical protein